MLELAKRMVDMSIYNPEYTYNTERVKQYLLEQSKNKEPNSKECIMLYNKINERRPPLANRDLVAPFEIFTSLRSFDYMKFIKRYGLENVLKSKRYAVDLTNICQAIIGYQGDNVAESVAHDALQDFISVYADETKTERMWDTAHRLQKIVLCGIAKGTVRRYYVKEEINILKQLNEFRKNICIEVYKDDELELKKRLELLEVEDLYLDDPIQYDKETTRRRQEYLDNNEIDLYNNLNSIVQGIKFTAKEDPAKVYTEYLELVVLDFKPEYLMYRSTVELSDTYKALTIYNNTFSDDNLKKHIISSLDAHCEGFTRYVEGTSFDKYVEKNLNLMAKYGVLTPRELDMYKFKFLGR